MMFCAVASWEELALRHLTLLERSGFESPGDERFNFGSCDLDGHGADSTIHYLSVTNTYLEETTN